MSHSRKPSDRCDFYCEHCGGQILIPKDLPPTTGPCPHCAKTITSPEPGSRLKLPNRRLNPKPQKTSPKIDSGIPPEGLDDLETHSEPIKLDASQHAETPTRQKKPPQPKKTTPTKPVLSRHPLATDQTSGPVYNDFEKMLIEETRSHKRKTITILTLLILTVASVPFLYFEFFKKSINTVDEQDVDVQNNSNSQLTQAYIQGGWEKEARDVLRAYLVASTSYGKIPHIIGGHSMLQEIGIFYKGAIINDLDTPVEAFTIKALGEQDYQRGIFRMVYQAKPEATKPKKPIDPTNKYLVYPDQVDKQPTTIHAFFKHTPNGLKLDWNIFAQTKYRTLLSFARQSNPRRKASFRVLIAQDNPSSDQPAEYPLRYRITDPANANDVIWASAQENSQAAKALKQIQWIDKKDTSPITRSATIELAWTGEESARELVVHRFICWEFLGLGGEPPVNSSPND